jgi:hypothetical protein
MSSQSLAPLVGLRHYITTLAETRARNRFGSTGNVPKPRGVNKNHYAIRPLMNGIDMR